jgi:hypothetical protein
MKASIDLHDFSVINNNLSALKTIKEHYPTFKISLFTIPLDIESETSRNRLFRDKALEEIHKNLDWMQIIPHGLTHLPREFEHCDRETMQMVLKAIDEQFAKDELPYEKGFCAPYWLWNQDVVDVLDENGWWGAVDRNQPEMITPKRYYKWSHSIDEPFWNEKTEVLKLHGHMGLPSANNLNDNLLNILRLPEDTEWRFITDFIE